MEFVISSRELRQYDTSTACIQSLFHAYQYGALSLAIYLYYPLYTFYPVMEISTSTSHVTSILSFLSKFKRNFTMMRL